MSNLDDVIEELRSIRRDLAEHVTATQNMFRFGPVTERDHKEGIRVDHSDDGTDKSGWVQPSERSGVNRYVPKKGEQVIVLAAYGNPEMAITLPLTHSKDKPNPADDVDQTVHHNRDGERKTIKDGHAKHQTTKKQSRGAGDGKRDAEGSGGGGANHPHELQRQLQGIRATLTQHDHNFAGLHDATSKLREIAQKKIPELAQVEPLLKADADSFGKAVDGAKGKIESYVAKTFQQMMGKLANGFMGNVMGLVQGAMQGQVAGILDQAAQLAAQHGVGAAEAPIAAARALADTAAGGGPGMDAAMGAVGQAFAGTPAEAAFAVLQGQMQGAMGAAGDIARNLMSCLDGQQNLVKGMTKSDHLGGYG